MTLPVLLTKDRVTSEILTYCFSHLNVVNNKVNKEACQHIDVLNCILLGPRGRVKSSI